MTTPITPVPDAALPLPDPADLATWAARMAEMHRWMRQDLRSGMNSLAAGTYDNAMTAVAAANFKGSWSSLTGLLVVPASVAHAGKVWLLLNDLADVTTSVPGTSADWQALNNVEGVPVGSIMYFPRLGAPSGWLKANGATLSRAAYVNLWGEAMLSGNVASSEGTKQPGQYGPGNGATTFTLPDLRGYVLRALDDGKGIDTSRTLGSAQNDAIKTSAAEFRRLSSGAAIVGSATGEFSVTSGSVSAATATASTNATGHVLQLGTATETRMKNIALLACIKF